MKRFAISLILPGLMMPQDSQAGITVVEFLSDRMKCPIGIDAVHPKLSWKLTSDERGQKQTAYQVLVASSARLLAKHEGDLWDSGNPFTDYHFAVTFTHEAGGSECRFSGYFAADGDVANSRATSGGCWRAHFSPDKTGNWSYRVRSAHPVGELHCNAT